MSASGNPLSLEQSPVKHKSQPDSLSVNTSPHTITPSTQDFLSQPQNQYLLPQATQPRIQLQQSQLKQRKSNIFLQKVQNSGKVNIFENKKSVNLLNLAQQSTNNFSIFDKTLNSKPIIQTPDSDQDQSNCSQTSSHPSNTQLNQEPTERIMKYSYNDTLKILETFELDKFRAGTSPTKQKVLLNLLEDQTSSKKMLYLQIKSVRSLIRIFSGMVLRNAHLQQFMGKRQNLAMQVLVMSKGGEGSKMEQWQMVKMQFHLSQQADKLKQLVGQYFKDA